MRKLLIDDLKGRIIMCGIVGYIGKNEAKYFLLKGLEKLEYRGYDSAGICTLHDKKIKLCKTKGRLVSFYKALSFYHATYKSQQNHNPCIQALIQGL